MEARERTLALVAPLSEKQIDRQYSPIMSPLAWDLGHVAAFADLWIARSCPDLGALRFDLFEVYDATETPRSGRGDLPYLRCREAVAYGAAVLERGLEALSRVDVSPDADPLNATPSCGT
jgi:iron(II)-dependent oxidoreductase